MSSSSIQQNTSVTSSYSMGDNVVENNTLNVSQTTLPKVQSMASGIQISENVDLQVTEPTLKVNSNKTIDKPLPDVTPNVLQKNSELVGTNIQQSTTENSKHPHLGEAFTDPISQMFTEKPSNKIAGQAMVDILREKGIIDKNGVLNCDAMGEGKAAKKAHIKGKVFVTENGFDFSIRGRCGDDAVKVMSAFKEVLEGIKQENPGLMKDLNLSIEPNAVAEPSAADLQVLSRGGQIQYKPLPNGQVVKMVLDPGENGEDDGLSISVYDKNLKSETVKTVKIPLKVVFEGGEYGDEKTRALKDDDRTLLPNWRNQRLFEDSSIQKEYTAFIPGIHSLSRKDKDNTGDVKRIQAQNQLWNAVYEYLKIKVDSKGNEFIVNNKKINENYEKESQATLEPNVNKKSVEIRDSQNIKENIVEIHAPEKGSTSIEDVELTVAKKVIKASVKPAKKNRDILDAVRNLTNDIRNLTASVDQSANDIKLDGVRVPVSEKGTEDAGLTSTKKVTRASRTVKKNSDWRREFLDVAKKFADTMGDLKEQVENEVDHLGQD